MARRSATPVALAAPDDAESIVRLRNAVADDLTTRHGRGWWSRQCTLRGVLFEMRISRPYLYHWRGKVVATFRLATQKPWAIDTSYFTPVDRALYLHSMAVLPAHQGGGIGTRCLEAADKLARTWPASSVRLDAFDHAAGAGEFYRKAGFREVGRVTYRHVPLIYFERLL